jgi:ABC-type multidrug transport system ATPase subunit
MFIPFFNFGKIFLDISTYTTGTYDFLTDSIVAGPGFAWSNLYEAIPVELRPRYDGAIPDLPAPVQSWGFMFMNVIVFSFLTWYFDNVIPDEFGKRKPLYFFALPSYWGFGNYDNKKIAEWLGKVLSKPNEEFDDEEEQVKAERKLSKDMTLNLPLRVINLRKEYRASMFRKTKKDKVAVKSLCIGLEESKCLALLGQNGAGKSTSMNILSGLTPSTSGDALVYGYSVKDQMEEINKFLGCCPQHDVLFGDLTAFEHIELYGGIKGLNREEIHAIAEERLTAVKLWKVRDQRSSAYSGGMKRRLSMIIATIGDPKVVYLDEPTTGMDPVNRRHVWSFIEKFKKGRVVILTTHSMEEADVLGDRIAIMAHGRLRALGNSIYLKNRYGAGYRISVVCEPTDGEKITNWMQELIPEGKIEDNSAGSVTYQIPLNAMEKIPTAVRALDLNAKGIVKAWGISQATLEEVFLKLIREANPGGYNAIVGEKNETTTPSKSVKNTKKNVKNPSRSNSPSMTERPRSRSQSPSKAL